MWTKWGKSLNNRDSVFQKYSDFMSSQNNIIAKILLHNGKKKTKAAE